jgi:hypothetical protein
MYSLKKHIQNSAVKVHGMMLLQDLGMECRLYYTEIVIGTSVMSL